MTTAELEDVDGFRQRARQWIGENLRRQTEEDLKSFALRHVSEHDELSVVAHARDVQRRLFEGGFAGICFPKEYGGLGLSPEHQKAFNEEIAGYEWPDKISVPTLSPCATILLEFGTEEQKRRHIPAILKGEEIWMQLLSEPSGGSDVASAQTTAIRDGDEWVLNGSKIWTTGAWWSDWGLCLARTNWDVPKHRGLTVFILPLHQPGVELQRIEMLNGNREFCQEFLTDVRVPDSDRVGDVDDGWTVGVRWMFHERMQFNSPYVTYPAGATRGGAGAIDLIGIARRAGNLEDSRIRDLIGESKMLDVANRELQRRLGAGIAAGKMSDQAAAIGRLFSGLANVRRSTIAFEVGGAVGGAWSEDEPGTQLGIQFMMRQTSCIGGGTTEMAANVVAERVLGMPRERAMDRDVPFRDVPRGPNSRGDRETGGR
jgi:alkylation response protein AidB-like acyl-CoA dehydrogenase